MRRLLLIVTALAAILALPATTLAAGPERSSVVLDFTEPSVFATCDGFDLIATTAHIERDSLTWQDADCNDTFERRVAYFDFTLVNSVSGTEGRYVGRFVRTEDFVTGEEALLGAFRQIFIDNRNVWSASGRNTFLGDDEVHISGRRSLYEWEAGLCDAMA